MIRWGRLALLLTPLVLVWAGTHFFLDRGIRQAIQTAGTAAVGARVDVAGVSTRFWRLSATVRGLAVTDPEEPMTNAVEIGALRFKLEPKPLFWRKFIVETAEISNIRTGTPRRTSGALPEKAKSSAPKEKPSAVSKVAADAWGNLKDAYDPKKLVSPENLASYRKAIAERDRLTALSADWKNRTKNLDVKDLSRRAQELADKVKKEKISGAEGILKVQALLKEGKDLKGDLSEAQKLVKTLGTDVRKEVAEAKATVQEIDRLRRADVDKAIAQVKAGFSTEGLTKGLLGPAWFAKLEKALGWIEKGRRLAGSDGKEKKAEETPKPIPTRQGKDIPFPFHYHWPTFHLKRAAISGETPGGLAYEGTLQDVTSDPKLLGKPSVLQLAGRAGERALKVDATLDLTTEVPREKISADYTGLPLNGLRLGSLDGGPISIERGRGNVNARVEARGDALSGTLHLDGTGLALEHAGAAKTNRLTAAVENVLKGLTEAKIGVGLSGTIQNPQFALNTTVDDQIRGALKGALDQEVAKLRGDVEKEIGTLVGKETTQLTSLIEKSAGPALEKLNLSEKDLAGVQDKIKKALDDLAGAGTKSLKIPDFKGLFKKK